MRLWDNECVAKLFIEAPCKCPRQFNMLHLIIPDRHDLRVIKQNVCRHQCRIGKQSGVYAFLAFSLGLVLKLGHAFEFRHFRNRV